MKNAIHYLVPGGMVGVTMLAGAILTISNVKADDSFVTTTTITVPMSCTMTGTGMNSHTAQIPNGIDSRGNDYYPDGIGQTTLKAYCNDNEGFSIYAVGFSDDTIGNTYLRDATLGQVSDILTSTTFSGANSAWAMKIGVTTGTYTPIIAGSSSDSEKQSGDTDYSTWAEVPSSYTRVAYRNSGTDVDNNNVYAEGASLTTTYAAYVSATQNAGNYVGQVKYTLVHPASEAPLQPQIATSGCINYFPNGSGVVGTMGCQSISASATSATLLAGNFSREGYGFAGWSNKYDYATNPNQEGIKFYGPQEDITFTAGQYTGTNNGLALYAVWVKSQGNLQDTSKVASVCSSLTRADQATNIFSQSITALTDQRDSQTYAVAKLADGQCWMIENLRLESTAEHNSDGTLAQGYNSSFAGLANVESADFLDSTTANSLYSTDGSTDKTISGSCQGYRFPRYNNTNTSARASSPTANTGAMYSYGNYYTWHAAIADTTYYSSGDHGTTSLCPTGWRLPIGNQSTATNSFGALSVALGGPEGGATANSSSTPTGAVMSKTFRSYPNNFLYSGLFNASSALNRGSYGYYWSSTANGSNISYDLSLGSSFVRPGTDGSNKYSGLSIRCTVSAST